MPVRRAAALLLLLAVLTSCGRDGERPPEPRPVPSRTTDGAASSADPTDSAWVQLMIPMDQQALILLDLAAEKATVPRLRDWASRLRTAQNTELAALRGLRDRMGLPDTDLHKGHDMPGMVTPQDIEDARTAEGAAFDRLLMEQIRDHLRQSQQVSRSEVSAGSRGDARARARELVTARGTQLAALPRCTRASTPADVPEAFACPSDHLV
ncbi:DUF305 domain-containing protein [Streptomyces sp. NPDC091271]|uniref:DUF305 domain-containing protein n=1 Tax=Streptomyces sp. NPDC091271 TaxID=3365980 RepID=UPI0037FDEE45